MEKIIPTIVALMCSITFVHGQTNTFPSSGNVGIGTTSPSAKLEVHGSSSQNISELYSDGVLRGYTNFRGASFHDMKDGHNVEVGEVQIGTPGGSPGFTINTGATHDQHRFDIANQGTFFSFGYPAWDYWGYTMNITENGNVGVGTTTPQSKLAVNGTVTAKQVKVTQTGWPDYVFDTAYSLSSLEKTAAYIQANKHLPGIPSAKEIRNEGLDVGEMQQKQMQKIEELTLYVIHLNEKLQLQDKKIDELTNELNVLKQK